jgi:hypothetical protein
MGGRRESSSICVERTEGTDPEAGPPDTLLKATGQSFLTDAGNESQVDPLKEANSSYGKTRFYSMYSDCRQLRGPRSYSPMLHSSMRIQCRNAFKLS